MFNYEVNAEGPVFLISITYVNRARHLAYTQTLFTCKRCKYYIISVCIRLENK